MQPTPEFEEDVPQMDAFFGYCYERGIEVMDSPNRILKTPTAEPLPEVVKGKKKTTVRRSTSLVDGGPTRRELETADEDIPNLSDDSVRMYLREIGKIPLLSGEDEVSLAKRKERGDKSAEQKLISSNLRLVVSIAKRQIRPTRNFFELVSDGNVSLLRAVNKFDFSRGNKFSTYATWAIMKNFARTLHDAARHRDRFCTNHSEMFSYTEDVRVDQYDQESAQIQRESQVKGILERLDERERQIVTARFGLIRGHEPQTLTQVGATMGVTKERVRQIQVGSPRQPRGGNRERAHRLRSRPLVLLHVQNVIHRDPVHPGPEPALAPESRQGFQDLDQDVLRGVLRVGMQRYNMRSAMLKTQG